MNEETTSLPQVRQAQEAISREEPGEVVQVSVVMLDKRHVWVVEVKLSDDKQWEPTIGVGIMRGDVTDLIKGWKKANPGAQFRTVRYTSGGEDQAYLA